MNIELSTASKRSPLEILDLQVSAKRMFGQSALSLRFLCRGDQRMSHLHLPTLSWFDASRLQHFSQNLSMVQSLETCRIDLPDAGLRLTGSADQRTTGRAIRIEPLASSVRPFLPFTIHASHQDITAYASKLYNRLWEFFTKG